MKKYFIVLFLCIISFVSFTKAESVDEHCNSLRSNNKYACIMCRYDVIDFSEYVTDIDVYIYSDGSEIHSDYVLHVNNEFQTLRGLQDDTYYDKSMITSYMKVTNFYNSNTKKLECLNNIYFLQNKVDGKLQGNISLFTNLNSNQGNNANYVELYYDESFGEIVYDSIEKEEKNKEDQGKTKYDDISDEKTEKEKKSENLGITDFGFCDEYIIQDGVKTVNGTLKAFQIVGYILFVLKILVPLVLVVITSIDLAKSMIAGDDTATKEGAAKVIKRIIIAIIIFFIPTILDLLLSLVDEVSETITAGNFGNCKTCLLDPTSDKCLAKNIGGIDNTGRKEEENTQKSSNNNNNNNSSSVNPSGSIFANSKYWSEVKYNNSLINIKNAECYKNGRCNEAYKEDGIVRVVDGVFYYPKTEELNGSSSAKGSGDKQINVTFSNRLKTFFDDASKAGYTIWIANQGFRTIQDQKYFWCCYTGNGIGAVSTSGKTCTAKGCNNGNTAAEPYTSKHGYGIAADLGFCEGANNTYCKEHYQEEGNSRAKKSHKALIWAHDNAAAYGLAFNVSNEDWHITPLYTCDINSSSKCNQNINYVCKDSSKANTVSNKQACGGA